MQKDDDSTPAIVGLCPQCRALRMAVVADGESRKDAARMAADAVRNGLIVETWTVKQVRENTSSFCEHRPAKRVRAEASQ